MVSHAQNFPFEQNRILCALSTWQRWLHGATLNDFKNKREERETAVVNNTHERFDDALDIKRHFCGFIEMHQTNPTALNLSF